MLFGLKTNNQNTTNSNNLFNSTTCNQSHELSNIDQIALLEKYIFTSNKDEFISSLVQNSDTYLYMKLMTNLNQNGLNLSPEVKKELERFTNDPEQEKNLKIFLKYILLQIEQETDQTKLIQLLKRLNEKYLKLNFDYRKPEQVGNIEEFEMMDTGMKKLKSVIGNEQVKMSELENYFEEIYGFNCLGEIGTIGQEINKGSFGINSDKSAMNQEQNSFGQQEETLFGGTTNDANQDGFGFGNADVVESQGGLFGGFGGGSNDNTVEGFGAP